MTAFAADVTLPDTATAADLQEAIANSTGATTITLTTAIKIAAGDEITIASKSDAPVTLTILSGRHFEVAGTGSLTLSNITLDGDGARGGVNNAGIFIMETGAVIQNCSNEDGGGVWNTGIFTMTGGTIKGNKATGTGVDTRHGGGVFSDNGVFTMDGGEISGNTAKHHGGGVYINTKGTFIMKDGEISGNTALSVKDGVGYGAGGGVFIYGAGDKGSLLSKEDIEAGEGAFTMTGGTISDNTANDGGGVFVYGINTLGHFKMTDGTISGNTAGAGAGVCIADGKSAASFIMEGGEISENIIPNESGNIIIASHNYVEGRGGGVLVWGDESTFTMTGGEINDNISTKFGGGVAACSNGTFTMSDSKISGNISGEITRDEDGNITDIKGNGDGGGVSMEPYSNPLTMTNCVISGNTAARYGGGVYYANPKTFTMNGGVISGNISGETTRGKDGNVTAVTGRDTAGAGVYVESSTATFIMENKAKISGNTSGNNGGGVHNKGNFTMTDSEISGNTANSSGIGGGGGVYINGGNATFTMNSGVISGNTIPTNDPYKNMNGGGVYAGGNTTFTMNGGVISGNTVPHRGQGGGVYHQGIFNMAGGEISENEANFYGGGVYVFGQGTFNMTGGKISGNEVSGGHGGGVYNQGAFNMISGEISGNEVSLYGGGVYAGAGSFTMGDGEISGNTAQYGGGVFITPTAVAVTISDGKISDNTATNNNSGGGGGGIYVQAFNYGKLTVADTVDFSGNRAPVYYTDAAEGTYSNIKSKTVSVPNTYVLNNYDINYISTPAYYSVTYNANGGSGIGPDTVWGLAGGDTFTPAQCTFQAPENKKFTGWNTQSDGLGQPYAAGEPVTMPENRLTLYAVWEPVVSYKLTIVAGKGGTVTDISGLYTASEIIDIAATANSGYTFSGWTSDNGDTFTNADSASTTFTMPEGAVTITANFTAKPGGGGTSTYSVTYTANGGVGSSHKVAGLSSGSKHTVLSLTKTGISYSGYTFDGWNTKANGSGTAYAPGESLSVRGSVTLYAQWEKVLFTSNHIKYLNGYPDGTVRIDNPITRAEASALFYRLLANPGTADSGKFSDVSSGAWYAQSVDYLVSIGIITGYSDGTFKPDQTITRAEFATIASRFDALADSSGNAFGDVPGSHWAVSYINSAYAKGWINGYPDGTFKPDNSITRAEVVKIVNTMLDRKIDDKALAEVKNPYSDITRSHWAYADTIEASIAHKHEIVDGAEVWQSW